ncbi:O-linked N-acetylglucosamine transferase, SPINDLY family protein [Pseudoduganella sp. OTU4001]|uniref:O-linked N-acetylglucosamine transferase, SPINDLY family protein n=1 Tax=Pseudoduganella sp. OTU4001 TaxID=3043854 RepID=UPI00313B9887
MTASVFAAPLPNVSKLKTLAARGQLQVPELFTATQQLAERGDTAQAIALYRAWLDHTISPLAYAVCFNLAVMLSDSGDTDGAEQLYRRAIALNANFIEARLNLGTLQERLGRPDDALATWRDILHSVSNLAEQRALHLQALNNLGRLLENRKRLVEAEAELRQSLLLEPNQRNVITHWVHLRQKLCEWPVYSGLPHISYEALLDGTSALAMLGASPDPAEQLAAARRFIAEKVKTDVAPLGTAAGYAHRRMRIGYLSSDFCSHAVSILTAELYELHDRARVEVYAFSWSREDHSPLRARVVSAMDHYIRIDRMSDLEAAECIRDHEIDILVDLHGLTLGARPGILCYRPAPVQLTWLGFPGSTAIPGVDYVVADRFLIPPELEPYFTEKPLHMPRTFQINDRQRAIGAAPTRAANHLPEHGMVYCSFNSTFKITPEVFGAWMSILQRVPDSVLWLVADGEATRANLVREAEARGVAATRLVFAARVPPADYLARYQVADLFLDTAPFNAGTTASDALWAGLPVLTCAGRTFSSRMAGSLLHAMDLPELVTHTLDDYIETAVALGQERGRLAALRARVAANRDQSPLFDTPRFVRDFEDLLETVWVRAPGEPTDAPVDPAALRHGVPAPEPLPMQGAVMLSMLRPGLHSVAEVGPGELAQAYRHAWPAARYTAIAPTHAPDGWASALVASSLEDMAPSDWQHLAAAQAWVFPGTLERLRDPWAMLKQIRGQASGPVEIIACVLNGGHWALQAGLAGGVLPAEVPGRLAMHWLTRHALGQLFTECGFAVISVTTVSGVAPPPAALAAIEALAAATGADPAQAVTDALPYQFIVRAIAA